MPFPSYTIPALAAFGAPAQPPPDPWADFERYLAEVEGKLPMVDPKREARLAAGMALLEAPLGSWDSAGAAVGAYGGARRTAEAQNQKVRSAFDLQTIDERRRLAGAIAESEQKGLDRRQRVSQDRVELEALVQQMKEAGLSPEMIAAKRNALILAAGSDKFQQVASGIRGLKPPKPPPARNTPEFMEKDGVKFVSDDGGVNWQIYRPPVQRKPGEDPAFKAAKEVEKVKTAREAADLASYARFRKEGERLLKTGAGEYQKPPTPDELDAYARREFARVHGRPFRDEQAVGPPPGFVPPAPPPRPVSGLTPIPSRSGAPPALTPIPTPAAQASLTPQPRQAFSSKGEMLTDTPENRERHAEVVRLSRNVPGSIVVQAMRSKTPVQGADMAQLGAIFLAIPERKRGQAEQTVLAALAAGQSLGDVVAQLLASRPG